jgi:transcriptional regulator with XRE-family HTH domain
VEQKLIHLRAWVARTVRTLREARGLTQADLAERLGSSQPRVANLEAGRRGFSIDFAVKALLTFGGDVTIGVAPPAPKRGGGRAAKV